MRWSRDQQSSLAEHRNEERLDRRRRSCSRAWPATHASPSAEEFPFATRSFRCLLARFADHLPKFGHEVPVCKRLAPLNQRIAAPVHRIPQQSAQRHPDCPPNRFYKPAERQVTGYLRSLLAALTGFGLLEEVLGGAPSKSKIGLPGRVAVELHSAPPNQQRPRQMPVLDDPERGDFGLADVLPDVAVASGKDKCSLDNASSSALGQCGRNNSRFGAIHALRGYH